MKTGDPKATYKALLLDYDWLLSLSDEECSYCLTEREAQIMLSMVEYVGWKTRYIRQLPSTVDQDVINQWAGNLARKLMSGCCGDNEPTNQRYTADGILEQSFDGGETWERDTSDPRFNSPIFPPMPGADGDDKKCLAAASAAETIKTDIVEKMQSTMTAGDILLLIAAVVAIFITGFTATPLVIAVVSQIIIFGVDATKAAFTEEVWDTFRCILYCNMNADGSFTEAQWQTIKAQIFDQLGSSIAGTFLRDTVNAFGVAGLTNAARSGAAASADCTDCDCPGCYTWDFELTNGGWAAVEAGASWVSGSGWETVPGVGGEVSYIRLSGFTSTTITSVEMEWTWDGSPIGSNGFIRYGAIDFTFTAGSPQTATGTDTDNSIEVAIGDGGGTTEGQIKRITVHFTGSNPFSGGDEC